MGIPGNNWLDAGLWSLRAETQRRDALPIEAGRSRVPTPLILPREANGIITVEAEGVSAELHGAAVEQSGTTVTVRLPSAE